MPTISDTEYEELERLRRHYRQELIHQSAAALTLEQDIDAPIKKCVMALALLGCEPMWSCCGFDYVGQPIHKAHQDDRAWVVLRDNERSRAVLEPIEQGKTTMQFQNYINAWKVNYYNHYGDAKANLTADIKNHNGWPLSNCIHFSEPAAIAIQFLEDYLVGLSDSFLDSVTLTDTNLEFQQRFRAWQYPAKVPWLIRKSDLALTERG